jgi:hypothetical protein
MAVCGTTWSPIFPLSEGDTGIPEPQDRIDFIYATKQLKVTTSRTTVVGMPQPPPNAVVKHIDLLRAGGSVNQDIDHDRGLGSNSMLVSQRQGEQYGV